MMHCAYYKPKFQEMARVNQEKNRQKRSEEIDRACEKALNVPNPIELDIIEYQRKKQEGKHKEGECVL